MASQGVNLAVTSDGEAYNKLQRPADYLSSAALSLPPLPAAMASPSQTRKRRREPDAAHKDKRPRVNQKSGLPNSGGDMRECGMRVTLPAGDNDEDQLSDSSMNEALAYLRSVRSEASAIPSLLVASTDNQDNAKNDDLYSDDFNDQELLFEDGAGIAIDRAHGASYSGSERDNNDEVESDAQDGYYKLLLRRFNSLRSKLTQAAARGVDKTKRNAVEKPKKREPPNNKGAWLKYIDTEYPALSHVLFMSEHALFVALQRYAQSLTESTSISHAKGCWIWTLLALTGDAGTLNHELVGKLRELGVKAGKLGSRLQHNGASYASSRDNENGAEESRCKGGNASHSLQETSIEKPSDAMPIRDTQETEQTSHVRPESRHDEQPANKQGGTMSASDPHTSPCAKETLEQARARLLAQLGDRLVQTKVPASRAEAEWQRGHLQELKVEDGGIGVEDSGGEAGDTSIKVEDMGQTQIPAHEADLDGIGTGDHASTNPDWNTRATIDMILTVVAECYGQKDLLKFRQPW